MGEDLDGKPIESVSPTRPQTPPAAKFVKSKWEAVDETELEAQGMNYNDSLSSPSTIQSIFLQQYIYL